MSPVESWRDGLGRTSRQLAEEDDGGYVYRWTAWVSIDSPSRWSSRSRDTVCLSFRTRDEAKAGAAAYMRDSRPYVYSVRIWERKARSDGEVVFPGGSLISRRKTDTLATMIQRVEGC